MPIRLTGINSGLDTETIISALVSSYNYKKEKYTKAQTKLSWKQDSWKTLNSKIYKMYTNVGNLRYSSSYNLKSTKVSDATKATVTGSSTAPNGEQKLNIIQTARSGYLTGGKLAGNTTAKTTLAELGYTGGDASIDVTVGEGASKTVKTVKVSQGTTVSEFVNSLKDAGVSANYDSANQRIFVNSKESGLKGDFSLTGASVDGANALSALGLNVESDATKSAYDAYSKYYDADATTMRQNVIDAADAYKTAKETVDKATAQNKNLSDAYGYALAYGAMKDALKGSALSETDQARMEQLLKMSASERANTLMDADGNVYNKKLDWKDGSTIYSTTLSDGTEKLMQKVTTYTGSDGNEYKLDADKNYTANGKTYVATSKKDADGNVIYENKDNSTDTITISEKTDYYEAKAKTQNTGRYIYKDGNGDVYTQESIGSKFYVKEDGTRYKQIASTTDNHYFRQVDDKGNLVGDNIAIDRDTRAAETEVIYEKVSTTPLSTTKTSAEVFEELKTASALSDEEYKKLVTNTGKVADFEKQSDNNLSADDPYTRANIMENVANAYASGGVSAVTELTNTYATTINENRQKIEDANAIMDDNSVLASIAAMTDGSDKEAAIDAFVEKVKAAHDIQASANYNTDAKKIDGRDAIIKVNGIQYEGSSNVFSINGLNITAQSETGDGDENAITITTNTDTQAVYDKVKDFITQYNELINEITSLYNADSAKGYEPLTDDEKEAMSDKEAEKYEQKIKDSILRRDSSLGEIMNIMTSAMAKGVSIDGKNYTLGSLGIQTLGFMKSAKNEQYAYHIDGDEEDSATATNKDKLMKMINEDPDKVMEIMQGIAKNLYDEVGKKMKSTSMRSVYTVYNDKQMQKEYNEYTSLIKKWEQKVEDMEDYYYKKFGAMETALATLNSQTSSLTGLLG